MQSSQLETNSPKSPLGNRNITDSLKAGSVGGAAPYQICDYKKILSQFLNTNE